MIKLNYKPSDGIYLTSDSHFSHKNIIKYCDRPFTYIEEMNETIINNWNSVVKPNNIVFHLGDFAFGTIAQWEEIRSRLNGHIHLILGNHDMHNWHTSRDRMLEMFESVEMQAYVEIGNTKLYLNHYPMLTYAGIYRKNPTLQCFGHVHLKPNSRGADTTRLQYCLPTQYDVGVDLNNFTPIKFEKVKERIQYQIDNNTNILHWAPQTQAAEEENPDV